MTFECLYESLWFQINEYMKPNFTDDGDSINSKVITAVWF